MTNLGGRPSKTEIHERRAKTRELLLKGKTPHQISKALSVHYNTALKDVEHIQARYSALIIKNSQLAKKQLARVEMLLDEINIIKGEYWDLYKEIQDKVVENKRKIKEWEKELACVKTDLEEAELIEENEPENAEAIAKARRLRRKFDTINREPKYPTYITARIDALKAIIDRLDKEAKLLNLFNPKEMIDKNYVSVEVLKGVMGVFRSIVMELIPKDKRGYAIKRLKTIDIQSLNGEQVVEAEFMEERPKPKKATVIEDDGEIDI